MSTAVSIYHGSFGRASLYRLDRPMTRHAHREGHLIFYVHGAPATVTVRDEERSLAPGLGVAVNPWDPHDFRPSDTRRELLCLVLYIRFLGRGPVSGNALRFGSPRIEVNSALERLIACTVDLLLQGVPTDRFDPCLYELTEECFALSHHCAVSGAQNGPGRDEAGCDDVVGDARVRRAIALMGENLGAGVELEFIARESGLSRPHFFKLFRRHTGLTPHLFLNTLRMERAIECLTESRQSVSDIGYDLGFSSQASFTRFFSSNVGLAPACYRRAAQVLRA